MPRYRFTGPDGKSFVVNAPEGASKEQATAIARKHIASMQQPKAAPAREGAFSYGMADAASLGFLDEAGAVLDTLGIGGSGEERPNIWRGSGFGEAFRANQQRNSEILGATKEAKPGEFLTGQIAGAAVLPTSKLSAAKGLKGVAGSAAEGAAYGGAYGAGSAEGGLKERAQGAKSGAAWGAGGGAGGRVVGNTVARAMRGKQVSPAVRKLADEGVVMTPGQRGGPIRRTMEEGVLGSIPLVKSIPQAAKRRGVEQFNVAAYNRALKPLGQKLPMTTEPGRDAVITVGDTIFTAYDDAASKLALGADKGLATAERSIKGGAKASVGQSAAQLHAIIDETLAPLRGGPVSGSRVRDILQDLRGEASQFATSSVANERRVGDQLWKLHDEMEAALVRQNKGETVGQFRSAREAVSLLKRVEAAAAKSPDGVFNPTQFRQAVTKRGYGTTTGKVARGTAPMQDLADAAKQVLPSTTPNSGTPERLAGLATLGGPGAIGAFVDPTMGVATGLPLISYAPGIDKFLQNLALNRPDLFIRGGNAVSSMSPALGQAGAVTAINQRR